MDKAKPNRIEELRRDREWSMEDLAQRANTTASQINKLEKGYVKLTWEWMQRLGRALECHPTDLLPLFVRPPVSADEQALLDRYRGLSDAGRQAVFQVADALNKPKDA